MKFNDKKVNLFLDDYFKTLKKIEEKHQMVITLDNIQYRDGEIKATLLCKAGQPLPYYTRNDFTVGEMVTVIHKDIQADKIFEIVRINKVNIKIYNNLEGTSYSVPPQWLQKTQ